MTDHNSEYSEASFWGKIRQFAVTAGREVIEKALTLYYCLQDKDTPTRAKTVILGALAYFISPIDAIPDLTPLIGYSDDLGALAMALAVVASHLKKEHANLAAQKLTQWFPG